MHNICSKRASSVNNDYWILKLLNYNIIAEIKSANENSHLVMLGMIFICGFDRNNPIRHFCSDRYPYNLSLITGIWIEDCQYGRRTVQVCVTLHATPRAAVMRCKFNRHTSPAAVARALIYGDIIQRHYSNTTLNRGLNELSRGRYWDNIV